MFHRLHYQYLSYDHWYLGILRVVRIGLRGLRISGFRVEGPGLISRLGGFWVVGLGAVPA